MRLTSLPSQRSTDSKDQQKQHQWGEIPRPQIRIILQRKNYKYQHKRRHDLGKHLPGLRHKWLWVRIENAGCRCVTVSRHSSYVRSTFELIDSGFVVAVDDCSATETS